MQDEKFSKSMKKNSDRIKKGKMSSFPIIEWKN